MVHYSLPLRGLDAVLYRTCVNIFFVSISGICQRDLAYYLPLYRTVLHRYVMDVSIRIFDTVILQTTLAKLKHRIPIKPNPLRLSPLNSRHTQLKCIAPTTTLIARGAGYFPALCVGQEEHRGTGGGRKWRTVQASVLPVVFVDVRVFGYRDCFYFENAFIQALGV